MSEDDRDEDTPQADESGAGEIAALRAEAAEMKDRMLRALAEAENVRRRAERERIDASQYAIQKFARDMLQIADNFARALAAAPKDRLEAADPQIRAVIEGVEVTERQLLAALESHGVKLIDTSDGKFDPNFHQAVAEVPGEGKPPGAIVHVVQPGYTIHGRLLRPAMVTVARREDGAAGGIDTRA